MGNARKVLIKNACLIKDYIISSPANTPKVPIKNSKQDLMFLGQFLQDAAYKMSPPTESNC